MELLNISRAIELTGLSDKTLRRAIASRTLMARPRDTVKQPLMFTREDIDTYMAYRRGPVPDVQFDQSMHNQIAERLTVMQQQIETLIKRVQGLENAVEGLSDVNNLIAALKAKNYSLISQQTGHQTEVQQIPETGQTNHAVTKQPKNHTRKVQERIFEMADFSKKLQSEYKCKVTEDNIYAELTISTYTLVANEPDLYTIGHFDWLVSVKRDIITEDTRKKGSILIKALYDKVLVEMTNHGWIKIRTNDAGKDIYRKST